MLPNGFVKFIVERLSGTGDSPWRGLVELDHVLTEMMKNHWDICTTASAIQITEEA